MDKIKLQKQVEELKAKLAEVEHELAKPELVSTYWQPEVSKNERYYCANHLGTVENYLATNDASIKRYRVFKTEDEAEKYADYVKAEEVLKAEIARLNEGWLPDWKDDQMSKHHIYIINEKLGVDLKWSVKTLPNFMYLKSKELAEQLTATHSKELITYLSY